ncbi:MAG: glycosyltransferase family 2 protein [Actinobacteria bacterium]|nr:glycosyltransferase family 2 protein [Actinomycetota bacterium]
MASRPLPVTVVIPAFRRADMLERAITSVLAQREQPAEILVVDDASGDETGARAEALGVRVMTHDLNRGRSAARNSGLHAARQEWIALLDSDDEWLPHHLETLWKARGGHDLVGTAALVVGQQDDDGRHVRGWAGRHPCVLRGPADVATPENKFVSSGVMIRRAAALEAGGFRPELERAEDLDLWLRMLANGSGLALPYVTVLYRVHPAQITTDLERMRIAHREVMNTYRDRPWSTRWLRERQEGALAWDEARQALSEGAPRLHTVRRLLQGLASPGRVSGLASLLAGRYRSRRLAARASRTLGIATLRNAAGP